MKKRNLFLSLICSIALTIALVTVTIVSIIPKKNNQKTSNPSTNVSQTVASVNNEANDGTAQKPFILYDAQSFIDYVSANGGKLVPVKEAVQEVVKVPVMVEAVDEDGNPVLDAEGNPVLTEQLDAEGNVVYQDKVDEEGNVVYQDKIDENGDIVYQDVLDENGEVVQEGCHFVLNNDIDFSGIDFKTLFNQDKPFIGNIDGKGFALINISINVTAENFVEDFAYQYEDSKKVPVLVAHIGVFGNVENATIKDVSFENLNISVADEVNALVSDAITVGETKVSTLEITVGGVAGIAKNSTLEVDVEAVINATPYSLYSQKETKDRTYSSADGFNTMGAVVGYAQDTKIANGDVKVEFVAKNGKSYWIGGVAGYAYKSTIENMNADVAVETYYTQANYVGGVAGYINTSDILNTNVNLSVKELGARFDQNGVVSLINDNAVTWIGGAVAVIGAQNNTQISNLTNVIVVADVEIDALFGGIVLNVSAGADNEDLFNADAETYVTFTDVIAESKVDVLKGFGFARFLCHSNINITENGYKLDVETGSEFNVKMVGNIILDNVKIDNDNDGKTDRVDYSTKLFTTINNFDVATGKTEYNTKINGEVFSASNKIIKVICSKELVYDGKVAGLEYIPMTGISPYYASVELV